MKQILVPHNYSRFVCIAGACRHTCCVGWEIDIDPTTLARYNAIPAPMGDHIRASIDYPESGSPCFRLTTDERCPHLTADGLCRIIQSLGEDALCGICRDHPRFRNHLPDGTVELGLGLTCEAACALILGEAEPFHLLPLPEPLATRERAIADTQDGDCAIFDQEETTLLTTLRTLRDDLLVILTDRTRPLGARIARLSAAVGGLRLPAMSFSDWADYLRDLERLDPAWDACLTALCTLTPGDDPNELLFELSDEANPAYEHLLAYFLYRYMTALSDLDLPAPAATRVSFAIAATALIHAIARATAEPICEIARMFSSEVEYSEDNRATFFELLAFA